MAKPIEHVSTATPQEVWEVIADGWTYPLWVVGASRMRAVTPSWPAVGEKLHHSVGTWPALVDDETTVEDVVPGRRIRLKAEGGPLGRGAVEITVGPHERGSLIRIEEDAVSGPGRFVPGPARQAAIRVRNRETLKRLALVAERSTTP